MRIVKRLYGFILKSFIPLFAMTFFIVLFIVLMQFLWKHIDDLVGKGLPISVIGELFFYAAVSMVPMALPLAILLASLMTFGNLGEKFELTAMKASGISLVKSMRPLIILTVLLAIGAFFFQNYVLPPAQVKMWTLLFSMRQKSPELEIPEGVFYDQIPGYNLLVGHKDRETGMLYDMMIYDVTRGGDNATILVADSGRLAFTGDMTYLYLHLHHGEQFENLREQKAMDRNVPFRRESFHEKEVLIPFDANFNRLDEGGMRNQYVGKNMAELQHTIDSVDNRIDSIGNIFGKELQQRAFPLLKEETFTVNNSKPKTDNKEKERHQIAAQSVGEEENEQKEKLAIAPVNLDSLILSLDPADQMQVFENALRMSEQTVQSSEFKALTVSDEKKTIRRHEIELLKKFTLSVACVIFFFIGAPLGAIIRKGGLGTPLVISVLLFLFYYIIDNAGYKMARDGHWAVWVGIWLSTFVLAPLGVFVTYKAMNDSAVFDFDKLKGWIRRLKGEKPQRELRTKEVIINEISDETALEMISTLREQINRFLVSTNKALGFKAYWDKGYDEEMIVRISEESDALVDYLSDSPVQSIVNLSVEMPIIQGGFIYNPKQIFKYSNILKWIYPLSYPIYLFSLYRLRDLRVDLKLGEKVCDKLESMINDVEQLED